MSSDNMTFIAPKYNAAVNQPIYLFTIVCLSISGLHNHIVERATEHKHLGVTLSYDLRWTSHINNMSSSGLKKLCIMQLLKYKLYSRSLKSGYMSYIRPSLKYSDCLWAGACDVEFCKLDDNQIKAMRVVTGATA